MIGKIRNKFNLGIFEHVISKIKSLKFVTEAIIIILRIDAFIRIKLEKNKEPL